MDIRHAVELIELAFELAGIAVLLIGSIIAFVRFFAALIRFRDGQAAYRQLRLHLGRSIVLGLELLVASDIILAYCTECYLMSLHNCGNGARPSSRTSFCAAIPTASVKVGYASCSSATCSTLMPLAMQAATIWMISTEYSPMTCAPRI